MCKSRGYFHSYLQLCLFRIKYSFGYIENFSLFHSRHFQKGGSEFFFSALSRQLCGVIFLSYCQAPNATGSMILAYAYNIL